MALDDLDSHAEALANGARKLGALAVQAAEQGSAGPAVDFAAAASSLATAAAAIRGPVRARI